MYHFQFWPGKMYAKVVMLLLTQLIKKNGWFCSNILGGCKSVKINLHIIKSQSNREVYIGYCSPALCNKTFSNDEMLCICIIHISFLYTIITTRYMWLLRTSDVASVTEEHNLMLFNFNWFKFKWSHGELLACILSNLPRAFYVYVFKWLN